MRRSCRRAEPGRRTGRQYAAWRAAILRRGLQSARGGAGQRARAPRTGAGRAAAADPPRYRHRGGNRSRPGDEFVQTTHDRRSRAALLPTMRRRAVAGQEGSVDEALRVALRIIEERAALADSMAEHARVNGRNKSAPM